MAVLGSPSLILLMVSVDVKAISNGKILRGQELRESRGGRSGLPVPNSPYGLCGRKATVKLQNSVLSGVKVEVAVLGSKSLTVPTVSVNVKIRKNTK